MIKIKNIADGISQFSVFDVPGGSITTICEDGQNLRFAVISTDGLINCTVSTLEKCHEVIRRAYTD